MTVSLHQTRNGRYPACVGTCPVGARKFGNLLDPNSEIRQVIDTKRIFVLKEELDTSPKFETGMRDQVSWGSISGTSRSSSASRPQRSWP